MAASRTASTPTADATANRTASGRISFAKIREPLEVPDLLALQTESFDWLLGNETWQARVAAALEAGRQDVPTTSGLEEIFEEISPIEDFSGSMSLSFRDHRFEPPKYSVEECKEQDITYSAPLFVTAEFMNNTTGEIKSQTVFMGDFPLMTERGTFIINGTERVVVSQLVRSPGRLLRAHRRQDLRQGRLHAPRSSRRAVPGSSSRSTSATRSASASTASASSPSPCCSRRSAGPRRRSSRSSATYESMRQTLEKDHTTDAGRGAARHLPQAAPGRAADASRPAQTLLDNLYFNPKRYDLAKVGRYKMNKKLGLDAAARRPASLTVDDIVATIQYIVDAARRRARPCRARATARTSTSASRSTTSTTSATVACARSAS